MILNGRLAMRGFGKACMMNLKLYKNMVKVSNLYNVLYSSHSCATL